MKRRQHVGKRRHKVRSRRGDRRVGKCECGGEVRGNEAFGRLFTWCESCTPVVTILVVR